MNREKKLYSSTFVVAVTVVPIFLLIVAILPVTTETTSLKNILYMVPVAVAGNGFVIRLFSNNTKSSVIVSVVIPSSKSFVQIF